VLEPRPRPAPHLDRTSVGVVDDAVGDGDVFGLPAAEAEYRPSRAERAVRNGHELVAAEERARVVLADHVAVRDVNVLAAVDVTPVVVEVPAVINPHPVQSHAPALENARAVVRAGGKENVSHQQILAAVEDQQMWALVIPFGGILSGAGISPLPVKNF